MGARRALAVSRAFLPSRPIKLHDGLAEGQAALVGLPQWIVHDCPLVLFCESEPLSPARSDAAALAEDRRRTEAAGRPVAHATGALRSSPRCSTTLPSISCGGRAGGRDRGGMATACGVGRCEESGKTIAAMADNEDEEPVIRLAAHKLIHVRSAAAEPPMLDTPPLPARSRAPPTALVSCAQGLDPRSEHLLG